jgi:hypothetical protein
MSAPSLVKQPAESRMYTMDFSPLLGTGETLTGVTSVTALPADLTLSGVPTYSGVFAQQRIAGGTAGVKYVVTFLVTTSGGNTLEGEGVLQVKAL